MTVSAAYFLSQMHSSELSKWDILQAEFQTTASK